MTKLAIGVTIDRASSTPETARFIYTDDPATPSPPYLQNAKGDIVLPDNKIPVSIQFRLMQEEVMLANNQSYALSLPSKALQIEGPDPGKWPQQFNAPAQSGKPGKPPTVVVVTDRNDDTMTYKYGLAVVFTPITGTAITKVDDPKIRNGGETRGHGAIILVALAGALTLVVALVVIRRLRTGNAPKG